MASRDLDRFVAAQAPIYAQALGELRGGRKRSHWMWFVFPQLAGLGQSATSRFYALDSLGEARAYLAHPLLGERLRECTRAAVAAQVTADVLFGYPDTLKFRSSMTLFEAANPAEPLFGEAIERLCDGHRDQDTLALLERSGGI
ncbi:DUF1810 domain-containing protein [soil metagenome]